MIFEDYQQNRKRDWDERHKNFGGVEKIRLYLKKHTRRITYNLRQRLKDGAPSFQGLLGYELP